MNSKDHFGNEMIKTVFGNIPNDWKLIDFKDILKIRSEKSNDEEIVKYSITNTGIHKRDEKFNKQLSKSSSKFKIIYKNDLVFGMSRKILNFGVMKEDIGGVSSAYNVFKIDESIDPRYLELFIRVWSKYFKDIIKPASREGQGIDKNILLTKQFFLPTNEYLQYFFHVFDTFNEKIELNNQMNQTLENICKAIFKHWFIHFEFPDENGNPYKSNGGEMVDSELMEIPLGWKVGNLNEFGKIVCGKTPPKSKKEYFGGKVPFIKIPDMHNKTFIVKTDDSLTQQGKNFQKNKTLPANSICVSCIATVGLVCITHKESQSNQQINSIIPKNEYYTHYLYYKLSNMKEFIETLASGGTATLNLNTTNFSRIKIIIPDKLILKNYFTISKPIFDHILHNSIQNENLSQIRDYLLPKLMSGQIRINVPEEISAK